MRKAVIILLTFISIIALILRFGSKPLIKTLGLEPRAGLRVESDQKSKVTINGQEVGSTPYQNQNLKEGEYQVSLKKEEATSSSGLVWQGYVKLYGGTVTVVNRELSEKQSQASGEIITLEKGKGVTVISNPSSAQVLIDGKAVGRTPISISSIAPGEHQFLISKENFLKRSIRVTLEDGYNLTLNVDLAQDEVDLTKIVTVPIKETQQVIVTQTPTGFLRVREEANLNSKEVARVAPGDTLTLLEEIPNWNRVRLPDGKEGYVSSSYTEKKE
ncbi:PEGA domain-containing protein [Candidatus Daviesbacteria bacterium]|nr:PEGA domain-containing protein [Candidatus Daviesbacteria bacterium]